MTLRKVIKGNESEPQCIPIFQDVVTPTSYFGDHQTKRTPDKVPTVELDEYSQVSPDEYMRNLLSNERNTELVHDTRFTQGF